jgi:subtilisin family serine protease
VKAAAALLAFAVAFGCAVPAGATPGPDNAPEYWFDSWKVEQLWSSGARGQGIVIGEIDTGVNAKLPQLAGKVLKGHDFGDSGGDGRTDRDLDTFGHGTAMASIMVARPGPFDITGLAPAAKILPVAVPLIGTSDAAPDDQLPTAIRWAVDHGAKIINMSLGGKRSPREDIRSCPADEQDAIFYALRKGVILVAAVGNAGPKRNTVEEPAVCLGVISVGAVDESGSVADFSSRQPYLTVTAPGVNVPSLGRIAGEGFSGDGSSQASAIVSAVLALTWSKHRTLPARQVVTRLLNTLDDARRPADSAYGYGLVDGYRAVTANVPTDAPNPVYDNAAPFIARERAFATKLTVPPHPARGQLGIGEYSVSKPSWYTEPRVLGGLAAAAAGLLALVLLLVLGGRAARRRPTLAPVPQEYGRSGPPPYQPYPVMLPPASAGPVQPAPYGGPLEPWPPPRPLPGPGPSAGE